MIKILVADDEIHFADLLKVNLVHLGYEVDTAYDGKIALERINSNNYDFIFLDENMPELTGLELARYLKNSGAGAKVVIITGYEGINEGFARTVKIDGYLTKPIKTEDIDKIIRKLTKGQGADK
ncbi:MAG: response regulator [Candidatus Omnitrophota bacterium]|jgi:CheY-like chemotaxis protein|nr:response regulator [Candidatus Omnitrophota bacterium]